MKIVKKLLFALFIGLVLLFLGVVGISLFFGNEIKQAVVTQVNTQLQSPVEVKEIYFSAFENFPRASVVLKEVRFSESTIVTGAPLATFEKIAFTLNPWSFLFGNSLNIKQLILSNGQVLAAVSKKNKVNYLIFKSHDETSAEASTTMQFEEVLLENIDLSFDHQPSELKSSLSALSLALAGNFSEDLFALALDGNLSLSITNKGEKWVNNLNFELNTSFEVDKKKSLVLLNQTQLMLSGLDLRLNGQYSFAGESGKVKFSTGNSEISTLLEQMPQRWRDSLSDYKVNGQLLLDGMLTQEKGNSLPAIEAKFALSNGEFAIASFKEGLKQINLEGNVVWTSKIQRLNIDQFEARLLDDPIRLQLQLINFFKPQLKTKLNSTISLEHLKTVINLGDYNNSSGTINLNFEADGPWESLQNGSNAGGAEWKATMEAENLIIGDSTLPLFFNNLSFTMLLNNQKASLKKLNLDWNNCPLSLVGEANNLPGYLLRNEVLQINGLLSAAYLNLNAPQTNNSTSSNSSAPSAVFQFALPERITLNAVADISQLNIQKFEAIDVKGMVSLNENTIDLNNLRFNTCGGSVLFSGKWVITPEQTHKITSLSSFSQVNIQTLFKQLNNFGQQEITEQHLRGKLSGEADIYFALDKELRFLPEKLMVNAYLKIENGELIAYAPLSKLSAFAKVEDLKHVKFETLENTIQIGNKRVLIPEMEIKNNALNIGIQGTHSFDQFLDYTFRLQLKDLLARSYKAKNPDQNEFEEEEKGVNLFIKMQGPADNLKIRYAKKEARQNFKAEMEKEKQTLKNILRQEFNIDKKDKSPEGGNQNQPNWEDDIPE